MSIGKLFTEDRQFKKPMPPCAKPCDDRPGRHCWLCGKVGGAGFKAWFAAAGYDVPDSMVYVHPDCIQRFRRQLANMTDGMTWTDSKHGCALHSSDGRLIAKVRQLPVGGASAQWCNGMRWDVSDQTAQVEEQSSRWFKTIPEAKQAVEGALGVTTDVESLGRWLSTVTPKKTVAGKLAWTLHKGGVSRATYVATIQGRPVATIKHQAGMPRGVAAWKTNIEGWMWNTALTPGTPAAKLNIKESPVIAFPNVRTAKKAVGEAFKLLNNPNPTPAAPAAPQ